MLELILICGTVIICITIICATITDAYKHKSFNLFMSKQTSREQVATLDKLGEQLKEAMEDME